MTATSVEAGPLVPPEVVSAVFYGSAVSDALVVLVAELVAGTPRITWGNDGAAQLLGYDPADLRSLPVAALVPTLRGAELRLLLRRERSARMTLPVRTASGALVETVVECTPTPGGRTWSLRLAPVDDESDRRLRATAAAHEQRFSTLTERSPVPTLLSEQGMRLAHVNDAFCSLVGRHSEQLLGTGWMATVHPDDLDDVVEQVIAVLGGGSGRTRARLLCGDGTERTTVLRLSQLFTPGVGAGFVGTIEDLTDQLADEARLAHRATHDPLTGLLNRAGLDARAAERFRPGGPGLGCVVLALDDVAQIADCLGHADADALLVAVAARLRAAVGPEDVVARGGGEEFTVVGPVLDEDAAVALAGRLADALAPPVRLGGADIRPHAAIGVTVQTAEHGSVEELLRDASVARHRARAGGGGVAVLGRRDRAEARDRRQLVVELREAIERREIAPRYQPILRSADGAPAGVAARPAWHHRRRGPVSSAVFLPLAERSGLLGPLGELLLDQTCRQLAEWDRRLGGSAPQRVVVDGAALQVDADLPAAVRAALARYGLHPARLSIRLPESAARPADLPVDVATVDGPFVAELAEEHADTAAAVVALARGLGAGTVAAGVQTPAQAARLAALGVDFLQGDGLAPPMTGHRTAAWYAVHARRPATIRSEEQPCPRS